MLRNTLIDRRKRFYLRKNRRLAWLDRLGASSRLRTLRWHLDHKPLTNSQISRQVQIDEGMETGFWAYCHSVSTNSLKAHLVARTECTKPSSENMEEETVKSPNPGEQSNSFRSYDYQERLYTTKKVPSNLESIRWSRSSPTKRFGFALSG